MNLVSESKNDQRRDIWPQLFWYLLLLTINVQIASTALPLPKQWEVTQLKSGKLNYVWTLTDVDFDEAEDVCRESQIFKSIYDNKQEWMLELCFASPESSSPSYLEPRYSNGSIIVKLRYLSGSSKIVIGNYTLTLMSGTLREFNTSTHSATFKKDIPQNLIHFNRLDEMLKRDEKHPSRMNDTLVLILNASLRYRITKQFVEHDCHINSDAKLQSMKRKSQSYPAHRHCANLVIESKDGKNITTNSCLFYPLESDSSAADTNVKRVDFDFEILNETIHYLQYGEAPQITKMAKDLFVFAKKYKFYDLKDLSEHEICSNLSLDLDDLIKNLVFASKSGMNSVKSRIIHYIASQPAYNLDSPQFEELQRSHPDLIQSIRQVRDHILTIHYLEDFREHILI